MIEFILEHQIWFIIIYGIALIFLIACYFLESKITVLELLVSLFVFLVPIVNILLLSYSVLEILNRQGKINWEVLSNFFNKRVK